jgi:predicted MFS family arabinose efflux permease
MALLGDLTREESRTQAMALVGLSIGIAFSLSLIAGPLLGDMAGLTGIFYVTAGLALLSLALVHWLVPTPLSQGRHPDAQPAAQQLRRVLSNRRLLRLDFGIFALHLTLIAFFIVVPGLLQNRIGLPSSSHWWVYLSVMATAFFAMVPFIIVGEKKRVMKPVLCGAITLLVLACVLLEQFATTLIAAWGALFFFFMAFNLLEACLPSLISKESPAAAKGTAMGVYSTSQFMGAFVGGAVGGILLESVGTVAVFALMVVVLLIWLGFALTMSPPSHAASFVVPLVNVEEADMSTVDRTLRGIPGVEDVVIIADRATAYLKVDRQQFDAEILGQYAFVRP